MPSSRRPDVTTVAPSARSWRATSSPIPAVEPVTTQTLSCEAEIHRAASVSCGVTTILLARHGETDWNRERRWQGHADPPLNDDGPRAGARARRSGSRDVPIDAVYASDLRARARDGARSSRDALGLAGRGRRRGCARSTSASGRGSRSAEIERAVSRTACARRRRGGDRLGARRDATRRWASASSRRSRAIAAGASRRARARRHARRADPRGLARAGGGELADTAGSAAGQLRRRRDRRRGRRRSGG